MKRGFWTGLIAFILAKVSHYVITLTIGYVLGSIIGDEPILWDILKITDSPLLGIIYLIIATRFIYKKLLAKDYDNNVARSSNTDSKIPDQKNNLEIIDKIVENSSTNLDEVSKYSDSNAFDTNIETSWGGEEPSILTFFKKYISNKEELVLKKVETFKNNIFYAKEDSNQTGHIFIFFEEANEAIEKFKTIIEPHSKGEQFFKLKSDQVSSWISKYKSEIQFLNVEGCSIQLSKGVSLYRIDISLKNSFKWTDIKSVNKDKAIVFTFPFSSLIKNDLPETNFNFNLSESIMLASVYFNILDGNYKIPMFDSYYNEDEIKVFTHTEDFKSFWKYCRKNIFVDSIDPFQTEIFKNIFEKLSSEFTLFDRLDLSYLFIQNPRETFTIVNEDINAISSKPTHSDRTSQLFRLNKYFDIQDGEFILFSMMKKRMDEVKPYLNDFNSLEDLFDCMKNESDESAVELRKKLVGDLPLNLIDRPTNIKVAQEDNEAPFSTYSESTIENYNKAMEKLQSGNHQIASVELEKVIEHDNYMLPAYYNLTAIKINFEQDYVGAIKTLDKIINAQGYEQNPDKVYAGLFFNRGLAKSYLDREEAAITDFNESLKIDPEYTSCYGSRGCSLMNLNRNIEALDDFDKAISLGDKTFINYFNRGKCKQSLTKFSEALEDYNAAYELNPENDNVIMQRDLLQAMKDNGLIDQIEQLSESEDNNINIDEEKISFIYELLMRVSMADNKFDKKEALLIAASIHKMKELYQFEGKVKRAESLSFFSKSDEFSDDEKTSIIGLLMSLISIDGVVTYSELSLAVSFCVGLNLSMDNAEEIIDSICKNESLDKNTFYLYIAEIYSSMKNEMSDQTEENYDLVDQILNLEQEKVAEKFKSLPFELKTEIFFATIMYDEKRSLAREEADALNNQAWDKMENGAYDDALIDAKKSIDTLSMSNNNDTIALIYYHLKNYDEAIKYANVSIQLDESRSDHYITRAKIYIKLKKNDLAKIDLNKAIELDEENVEAIGLLKKL
jgi:tetratricopeptide (TPR) repeat protein